MSDREQQLREMLLKLANEASGFRCMADIDRHGATNMRVLGDRITEAFNLLAPLKEADASATFQSRVNNWTLACFGHEIAGDRVERNHRFIEEALELVQALDARTTKQRNWWIMFTAAKWVLPIKNAAR